MERKSRFREHIPKIHNKPRDPINPLEIDPGELLTCEKERRLLLLNAFACSSEKVFETWWMSTHYDCSPPLGALEAILSVVLDAESDEEIAAGIKALTTMCLVSERYVYSYTAKLVEAFIPMIGREEITDAVVLKYISFITCMYTKDNGTYVNYLITSVGSLIEQYIDLDETTDALLWLLAFSSNDELITEMETIKKAADYVISKENDKDFEFYTRACYELMYLKDMTAAEEYKEHVINSINELIANDKKLRLRMINIAEDFNDKLSTGEFTLSKKGPHANEIKYFGYSCYISIIIKMLEFVCPFCSSFDMEQLDVVNDIIDSFGYKKIKSASYEQKRKIAKKGRKADRELKEAKMNEFFEMNDYE